MLTLAVSDNAGTPTGLTATVAGSSGAALTVYAANADGPGGWASGGTRTGDGTVAVSLAAGVWWLYAETAGGVRSVPVLGMVTDGRDAILTRCRAAVVARLKLLDFVGRDLGGRVYEQFEPDDTGYLKPCVVCSVEHATETDGPFAVNPYDDVLYPVKVAVLDVKSAHDHSRMGRYELWRQRVIRAFSNQWIAGVPELRWCTVEPYLIADPQLPRYEFFATALTVRCHCWAPRGLNV